MENDISTIIAEKIWIIFKPCGILFQELYPTIEDIYVASVETERGTREKMRLYDTAGLSPLSGPNAAANSSQQQQLAKQLLGLTEGYVLIYDPAKPESFDCLLPLKRDIDKNRDKKEVS